MKLQLMVLESNFFIYELKILASAGHPIHVNNSKLVSYPLITHKEFWVQPY